MSEQKIVVDHMKLNYKGLFDVRELYKVLDNFFKEKGYDKRELRNIEHVKPEGKYIELELLPFKKVSDYAKFVIRVEAIMNNIKEVDIEKDSHQMKLNQGEVTVIFDGIMETDYEHRWDTRPEYVFIRTIFDKFVYRIYTRQWESQLVRDVEHLHSIVKSFLNLYRY